MGSVAVLAAALALIAAPAARAAERQCDEALVPMSDGVRLHAWVSRLPPSQPRPVLFMMTSYGRSGQPGQGPSFGDPCPQSLPDDYVPSYLSPDVIDRFTLVQIDYRGTGASEGLFDVTGARTQADIREAIRWTTTQPWSTGDVVLTGESGTGFYAYHGLQEPHVRAAVVFTSCADMFRCFRRGGQYNGLADVYFPVTQLGFTAGMDARNRNGTSANPDPAQQTAAITAASAQAKTSTVDDAYWKERSSYDELADVSIPVMYTTDLYDIVQPFDALQLTPGARFNFGMGHISADAVAAGGDRYVRAVRAPVDRFVAHYGLGDDNGAEHDPRVTLVTNTGSVGTFHDGHLLVRGEDAWPLTDTRWTRLYLGAGGALSADRPAARAGSDSTPLASTAAADLRTQGFAFGRGMRSDLRDDERAGLTYTTPAFRDDVEVTGPLSLRVFASATAPDFDWSVRVTDVWPDGRSEWITDGYLRATLRKVDVARSLRDRSGAIVRPWLTYDTPEAVPSGEPVEYTIDVIATSNVFAKGHRLRLDLLPSGESDSARTGGAGALTVLRDAEHPSALTVPVIPARCQRSTALVGDAPAVPTCAASFAAATPPARACASRRRVRLRLPRGSRSARIYVAGRLARRVRSRRTRTATVDLRGRARGRVTVRIVARTARGRVVQTRHYRTCTPKRRA